MTASDPHPRKRVAVVDTEMSYIDVGEGDPIVFFVEGVLPGAIIRTLSEEEMNTYRAPFAEREARLPTLIWPRQAPVDDYPEDVTSIVRAYGAWLSQSELPKLFIAGNPGAVITEGSASQQFCRTWKNQQKITVKGRHFLQEDSHAEIGAALRQFMTDIRRSARNGRK